MPLASPRRSLCRRAFPAIIPALLIAALAIGCGVWGNPSKKAASAQQPACTGGAVFPFNPRPLVKMLPWPTDLLTVPDPTSRTGIRLSMGEHNPPLVDTILRNNKYLLDALNVADGFSTTSSGIYFPVYGDLNDKLLPTLAQSTDAGSPIQLITNSPGSADNGKRILFWSYWKRDIRHIEIRPVFPLEPKTQYVVVIPRDGLKDWGGDSICPASDFDYMKSPVQDFAKDFNGELEPARLQYQQIFEFLESDVVGITRSNVALAFSFTTGSVIDDMVDVETYLKARADAFPPYPKSMTLDPPPGGQPAVDLVVDGYFDSPNFRGPDNTFNIDPVTHRPTPILPDEEIEFLMTIPKEGQYKQPFPVILFSHGVNASKEGLYGISEQMGELGCAVISIDDVLHGSRAKPGSGMNGLEFFDPFKPVVLRDNVRQSVADNLQLMEVVRRLKDLDVYPYDPETGISGDGIPDLDTDHILFWGHSLGALLSTLWLAVSPDIQAGVQVCGGGGYTDIVEYNTRVKDVINIINLFTPFEFPESLEVFLELANVVIEPANGYNFILHVTQDPLPIAGFAKDTLLLEDIGDDTVANETTEALARYGGFPQVRPVVYPANGLDVVDTPIEGYGFRQFNIADHNFYWKDTAYGEQARTMVNVFIRTKLETGSGRIVDPTDSSQW